MRATQRSLLHVASCPAPCEWRAACGPACTGHALSHRLGEDLCDAACWRAGGRKAWLWGCAGGAGREGRGRQQERGGEGGGRPVGTQNIGAGEPRAQVGEQRVLRHRRPHVVVPCRSNPARHGTPLPSALTLRPTPYSLHPTFSTHDPLHALGTLGIEASSAFSRRPAGAGRREVRQLRSRGGWLPSGPRYPRMVRMGLPTLTRSTPARTGHRLARPLGLAQVNVADRAHEILREMWPSAAATAGHRT